MAEGGRPPRRRSLPGGRRDRTARSARTAADRAVVPAVGKALEAGIAVLFVAMLAATLYGGVVPEYRAAAGEEVADRTLATATYRIEQAIPPNGSAVDARQRVSLPRTIRGESYVLRADAANDSLVLAHDHPAVGGRARLSLPAHVDTVRGEWDSVSGTPLVVAVRDTPAGLVVELREGST